MVLLSGEDCGYRDAARSDDGGAQEGEPETVDECEVGWHGFGEILCAGGGEGDQDGEAKHGPYLGRRVQEAGGEALQAAFRGGGP